MLLTFVCLLPDAELVPDCDVFSRVLRLLYYNEGRSYDESDGLLSALINTECASDDFLCLTGAMSKMPFHSFEHFKILSTSTVREAAKFIGLHQGKPGRVFPGSK